MCDAVAKGGEVGLRKFIREWVDNAQHGLADKLEAIVDEAAGEAMEPMYRNRHYQNGSIRSSIFPQT